MSFGGQPLALFIGALADYLIFWILLMVGPPALVAYIVSSFISKRLEKRKLAIRLVSWTLLLILFVTIAIISISYLFFYSEASRHSGTTSIPLEPLSVFSQTAYWLFFSGSSIGTIVDWAVCFIGVLAIIQSRRNETQ
jgi:membrane protease YdiL (CAAX protease family)